MKGKFLSHCLVVCVCLLASAASAADAPATFAGSFNITGYLEPALSSSYTYCFVFTKTGGVLFPNSGTWTVPSWSPGWNGTWYQTGDEIVLHGVASGTYIFSWKGRLLNGSKIGGRQVEMLIDGSTDTAGTFFGSKVSACAGTVSSKKGDPAR
jgi:hypothetical protein